MYATPVPAECCNVPCIMGIDEAGRGPVLGPMVYAVCYVAADGGDDHLRAMKVDDSKVLSEEQRSQQFHQIVAASGRVGFSYNALSPQDISMWMLQRSKYNLNAIAHDTTIALVEGVLRQGVELKHVYVDTVGPPASYQAKLKARFPAVDFTVAKKADSLYATVSAASIVAKVVRDQVLSTWQFSETALAGTLETKWGSGYPSDPNTVSWLKRTVDPVFGWPGIIRFSWSTTENLLKEDVVVDGWPADRAAAKEEERMSGAAAMSKFVSKRTRAGNAIAKPAVSAARVSDPAFPASRYGLQSVLASPPPLESASSLTSSTDWVVSASDLFGLSN
ncbi:ribonuclease H-like domain-containing protein [Blastocladiella britannica]|nr:ribonuclease H-like domain-containing protein [Blastocladiella britannica]